MAMVKNHYHNELERRRAVEDGYCGGMQPRGGA
jgi:hypothetical protein